MDSERYATKTNRNKEPGVKPMLDTRIIKSDREFTEKSRYILGGFLLGISVSVLVATIILAIVLHF